MSDLQEAPVHPVTQPSPPRRAAWPAWRTPTLALALALCCGALQAMPPAPWYQWRSKVDGYLSCSQTPLGPGWVRDSGPYQDSRCEKLLIAK